MQKIPANSSVNVDAFRRNSPHCILRQYGYYVATYRYFAMYGIHVKIYTTELECTVLDFLTFDIDKFLTRFWLYEYYKYALDRLAVHKCKWAEAMYDSCNTLVMRCYLFISLYIQYLYFYEWQSLSLYLAILSPVNTYLNFKRYLL